MKQQRPTSDDKKEEKSQQEKRKNACNVCIYCTVDWITWRNSKKSTNHWLKHTDAESQKWSEKTLYKNIGKNVASNYYMMKKYIKNLVYTNWLRTKCDLVMCSAHWKVWC